MQTVQVHLWDDLHNKEDGGKRVPADIKVELAYTVYHPSGQPGTRHVVLDLTGAHEGELAGFLARYLEAGEPPAGQSSPDAAARPEVQPGGKLRRKPPEGMPSREFRRQMRNWADSLKLVNRSDPRFRAWQTAPSGKLYYPGDLEDAFLLHLQGREGEALELAAQFKPQAP